MMRINDEIINDVLFEMAHSMGRLHYLREGQLKGTNFTNVTKVTRNLPATAKGLLARIAKITNSAINKEQTFFAKLAIEIC